MYDNQHQDTWQPMAAESPNEGHAQSPNEARMKIKTISWRGKSGIDWVTGKSTFNYKIHEKAEKKHLIKKNHRCHELKYTVKVLLFVVTNLQGFRIKFLVHGFLNSKFHT